MKALVCISGWILNICQMAQHKPLRVMLRQNTIICGIYLKTSFTIQSQYIIAEFNNIVAGVIFQSASILYYYNPRHWKNLSFLQCALLWFLYASEEWKIHCRKQKHLSIQYLQAACEQQELAKNKPERSFFVFVFNNVQINYYIHNYYVYLTIDFDYFSQHGFNKVLESSPEILVHIDMIASHSCYRLAGWTSMSQIFCSILSQKCSV